MTGNQATKPIPVAVGLIWSNDRLVIGRRPAGAVLAEYDELPGGKCLPNESPAEAVARECHEEAGLRVVVLGERLVTEHAYAHGLLRLHFFDCGVAPASADLPPLPAPFRWVDVRELFRLRFPPANDPLLDSLREAPRPMTEK